MLHRKFCSSKIDVGRSRREAVAISSCVRGYHVYKDRRKPRVDEKLACVRESTNIEDGCAVAVVENQDHVDAIESDRLPCGFGNTDHLERTDQINGRNVRARRNHTAGGCHGVHRGPFSPHDPATRFLEECADA